LYTKEFDSPNEDFETAYEIGEIDKISPVTTLPPLTTNQDEASK
jgi:hypothetical protein